MTNITVDNTESHLLVPLEEFLDRNHPASDEYMRAVELIQRNIMHTTKKLRPKHVQVLKSVFAGHTNVETAQRLGTTAQTVNNIKQSANGQKLLQLLNYHQTMLEGPNLAQRRNMLWRIAAAEELVDPKTAIKAVEALNKMTFQDQERKNATAGHAGQQAAPAVVININQELLPRGTLDG